MNEIAEKESTITYRLLEQSEWDKLARIFEENELTTLPNPSISRVYVAEADGEIVGFLPIQLAGHAEPLWIHKDYRGKVNWRRLVKMIDEVMKPQAIGYFVFAPYGTNIGRMAEIAGMEKLPVDIYMRRF